MKKEDRKAIAAMYENVDEYYLSSWLVSIAYGIRILKAK